MPSTAWKVATGTLIALVLGYAVVIASSILLGVVAATLVFLLSWLVAYARESEAVPQLSDRAFAAASALSFVVLAYSLVVAGQILFGVLAVVFIFGGAFAHAMLRHHGYPVSLGRTRTILVAVAVVLVMTYSLLVAGQILLGVIASVLLSLTAWLTSPTGPLLDDG
ncbi:hypothetical protein [Halogranum rubrum]|uniref:Uncharacterized protein n=1 Tax=Halogranum salarium B-1 TaxID=1210908 RepID=J3JHV4_9EURY|nr:hypothetical protein [Halogranum salarium]EJN61306.1 hypothetical protein HSB1_03470 [Halogranum salarium B-1]